MKKIIVPAAIMLALLICLTAVLVAIRAHNAGNDVGPDDGLVADGGDEAIDGSDGDGGWQLFEPPYRYGSTVGYSAEVLGTVGRRLPEVSDGGLAAYPVYGTTLYGTGSDAYPDEKAAILAENAQICAGIETYDGMDSDGNLYLGGVPTGQKLYKHTAAEGMYLGNVADDEPALVKKITIKARGAGNHITGLYAPAGEVLKIELSEKDLLATGGVKVEIGQAFFNGGANSISAAREFNRMPVILNTMTVTSAVGYVGSYLGGPVYIKPVKTGAQFTVTISGGVAYPHLILGYTTREEYEESARSSAPYFDLEVWDDSVRISGPASYASGFSYDQLVKAAELWEKISTVSNQVPSASANIGINFLYDCFVWAGSAVAFRGWNTVNCPLSWMTDALDYDSFVKIGSWGNIHEYNHHYQRYGFATTDEVTNNAVSLVSYSLFTNISAARTLSGGLSGWNRYTDPSWTLTQTIAAAQSGTANSNLDSYANILHSFGQDAFLEAARLGGGNGGADVWFRSLCEATHFDMTYYFSELLNQTVSESVLEEIAAKNYPMYVPAATVYQTGARFLKNGETIGFESVRPFKINRGEPTVLDFSEQLVVPDGFSYRIKSLTSPQYGKLENNGDGVYTYTPDSAHELSGKMILTIGITRDDGVFSVRDVQLVIELQQGANDNVIERTVYTYASGNLYSSAEEAYESGYAGYETVTVEDNVNPTQNGNAEVWVPNPSSNAVMELKGKVYARSGGKYRIALRGRRSVCLYVSLDGVNYSRAATLVNTAGDANFHPEQENSYADFTLEEGRYLYFKAVLLVDYDRAYIGLGWGKFDGDEVTVGYLTDAYRNGAYFGGEFTSENYYKKTYAVGYTNVPETQPAVVEARYSPWDENYTIDNLFDADENNYIHSDRTDISEENPFELTVDLGTTVTANRLTIIGTSARQYQPKTFKLYGGTSLDDMKLLADVKGAAVSNYNVAVDFETSSIRYYKLVVTDTYSTQAVKYIAFRGLQFSASLSDGRLLSPSDETFTLRGGWQIKNTLSTFGSLYAGENASLEFEFTGTQFAVFSYFSGEYDGFEVYIDGEKVGDSTSLSQNLQSTELSYLSPKLADGTHRVTIKSASPFNVDSIGIWQ